MVAFYSFNCINGNRNKIIFLLIILLRADILKQRQRDNSMCKQNGEVRNPTVKQSQLLLLVQALIRQFINFRWEEIVNPVVFDLSFPNMLSVLICERTQNNFCLII